MKYLLIYEEKKRGNYLVYLNKEEGILYQSTILITDNTEREILIKRTRRILPSELNKQILKDNLEKLFKSEDRLHHVEELMQFISSHYNRQFVYQVPENLLDKPINASKRKDFPVWDQWPDDLKKELEEICGPMMEQLGY